MLSKNQSMNRPKVLVIVGPTASGKTNLARFLAHRFNGEIVSADSRQVYRSLDIGTGKEGLLQDNMTGSVLAHKYPRLRYLDDTPQWLIDIADLLDEFSVAEYQKRAYEVIEDIVNRGKLPIIVGGTGLYVSALVEGYQFKENMPRSSANSRHSVGNNEKMPPDWSVLALGTDLPREELYRRIDKRLKQRLDSGMIEEAKKLLESGISADRLRQFGLEYRYLADLLEGKLTEKDFITKLKHAIHSFARRQLTWFRHHGNVSWISDKEEGSMKVKEFLYSLPSHSR